jgi:uncharacterized RmlC-like cupin family protein
MKSIRGLMIALLFASMGAVAAASSSVIVVQPGQEVWQVQPDKTSVAVLYGDPSKPGYYAMRVKLPPNWSEAPHYHPLAENVVLLSGTAYLGIGTKFNRSKATKCSMPGTFVSIPAHLAHYAFTTSAGAVIQVDGVGPFRQIAIK